MNRIPYPVFPSRPRVRYISAVAGIILCCVLGTVGFAACYSPAGGGSAPTYPHTLTADNVVIKITETDTPPSVKAATTPVTGNYYWVFLPRDRIDQETAADNTVAIITLNSGGDDEFVLIDRGTVSVDAAATIAFKSSNNGDEFFLRLSDEGYILDGGIPNVMGGEPIRISKPFTDSGRDGGFSTAVYVAGWYTDGGIKKACYWKDGIRTDLSAVASWATDIAVSGADVYVAGYYMDGGNEKACYWKNGSKIDLPFTGTKSFAWAIAVSGADVYTAGYYTDGTNKACYWKNGTKIDLPFTGTNGRALAITVSGTAVYVAGYYEDSIKKACYWKNGTKTDLSVVESWAIAIAVSGGDVYTAGSYYNGGGHKVCYWRNRTKTDLPFMGTNSVARDIAVSGKDVYTAGYYIDGVEKACYWKNGTRTDLPFTGTKSFAWAIAVSGADVYIAGDYSDDGGATTKVCYWKNGIRTDLPGTDAEINAIAVTQ